MRTTVRLDDGLMRDAKEYASRTGRTLTALIESALRAFMSRRPRSTKPEPPRLPTVKGRGTQPGVDLDNTAALLDLMDRGDAAR